MKELSPRQLETCKHILFQDKYISQKMGITLRTVRQHFYDAFEKTGTTTRLELFYALIKNGIISLDDFVTP